MDFSITHEGTDLVKRVSCYYSDLFALKNEMYHRHWKLALKESGNDIEKECPKQLSRYLIIGDLLGFLDMTQLETNYLERHGSEIDAEYRSSRSKLLQKHDLFDSRLNEAYWLALDIKQHLDFLEKKTHEDMLLDNDVCLILKCHRGVTDIPLCEVCNKRFEPTIHNRKYCSNGRGSCAHSAEKEQRNFRTKLHEKEMLLTP